LVTPTPETFDTFKQLGLPEITSFTIDREYSEEDTEFLDGTLVLATGTTLQLQGIPARVTLQAYMPYDDAFLAVEDGYELKVFLQGTPLFYDLDETNKQLSIRTRSGGQEYKIVLPVTQINSNEIVVQ
jgi:hypothetical protein